MHPDDRLPFSEEGELFPKRFLLPGVLAIGALTLVVTFLAGPEMPKNMKKLDSPKAIPTVPLSPVISAAVVLSETIAEIVSHAAPGEEREEVTPQSIRKMLACGEAKRKWKQ